MQSVKLNNGIEMPLIGFGVFQIPENECEYVVVNAIKSGYRLIDTASSYKNEEAVGHAISRAQNELGVERKDLFITTKAFIQEMGYDKTLKAFDESLSRLSIDYLDLYLIHMPFGDYYGSYRALESLYKEGRVKAIGVCNFLPDRLLDLCNNVTVIPQVNQIEHHPHYQRREDLDFMQQFNIQPEAWAPFAEGLKGMFDEPVLKDIAQKYGKTPAQVILRWNIEQGIVVIPKTVHEKRMMENFNVFDFALDAQDMVKIKTLDKNCPSMLDTRNLNEIRRVYDYLKNPVLTSL